MLTKKGFSILLENEQTYFAHLEGILMSVDELAEGEVIKNPSSYTFRIAPSAPSYYPIILETLLTFHSLMGIRIDMSKSMKKLSTINFSIST